MNKRLIKTSKQHSNECWRVADYLLKLNAERQGSAVRSNLFSENKTRLLMAVAKAIPVNRRNKNLSFDHHQAVHTLSQAEQDQYLRSAEINHWTTAELHKQIRQQHSLNKAQSVLQPIIRAARIPKLILQLQRELKQLHRPSEPQLSNISGSILMLINL